MNDFRSTNGMDDGSLAQIQQYEGTTKDALIGIESRDLKDKSEALKLMRENGVFLPALSARLQRDKEVIVAAIKSHPYTIMDLPLRLRSDAAIQKAFSEGMEKKAKSLYKKQSLTDEMRHILELMLEQDTVEISSTNSEHAVNIPAGPAAPAEQTAEKQMDIADILGL